MLRSTFILFILFNLINTCVVSPFTDVRALQDQTVSSNQLATESAFTIPFLNYLQTLRSSCEGNSSDEQSDNFSDYFRMRHFSYRLSPVLKEQTIPDLLQGRRLTVISSPPPFVFEHLITLPTYYRLLFRLTPF
jgi:hypothetical protein